jgi:hypothetical protein
MTHDTERLARRAEIELAWMGAWADAERAKGRPEGELTWGNCVVETGVLQSADGVLTPANLAYQRAMARVPEVGDLRGRCRAVMAALMQELAGPS